MFIKTNLILYDRVKQYSFLGKTKFFSSFKKTLNIFQA